jgi:hypothetical protein
MTDSLVNLKTAEVEEMVRNLKPESSEKNIEDICHDLQKFVQNSFELCLFNLCLFRRRKVQHSSKTRNFHSTFKCNI